MAETFGAVAGALSVAALFNNCVDCFGYIQLGRHFGSDFERCQLKLDIAWSRFSRWGEAVAINMEPRFAIHEPSDATSQQVWRILDQIRLLFEEAQKSSSRYETAAGSHAPARPELTLVARDLHGRMKDIVHQRQKRTGLWKKFAWALYDSRHLDKLIGDILTEQTARVKVGNYWSESVLSCGFPVMDKTGKKAGAITARGASIIHIGTSFGGRSIFD